MDWKCLELLLPHLHLRNGLSHAQKEEEEVGERNRGNTKGFARLLRPQSCILIYEYHATTYLLAVAE